MLFGMYLVVKYLGKEWINRILGWYFAATGVAAVWTVCTPPFSLIYYPKMNLSTQSSIALFRTVIGQSRWMSFDRVRLSLTKGAANNSLLHLSLRTPSLYLFPLACVPSLLYTISTGPKSAILTNILGLSFAHTALGLLKLDSFRTGSILLAGLFVYDIWWVFGTEVVRSILPSLPLSLSISLSHATSFTDTLPDGQSSDEPRPPYQDPMAEVAHIQH
jgi:minor histocompatibility antigen H13